ncbi:MAG: N-acetylmuramoyl-L-alanine amidase, partial [Bacteroidota bacterium]
LTILIWLLPSSDVNASVKDILNNQELELIFSDLHITQLITHINHIHFEEYKDDGRNRVMIDAGHGGHDPGALGRNSKEKDIALRIALKIGEKLAEIDPTLDILYTRETDIFIPLHQRIGLANKEKTDLFISIHCNYVDNPHVCGTETFVMGLHRAEENLQVAKRENSAILLENEYEANYEGYDPNSPVGHILLSMIQNVFLDNSIELASNVENYFGKRKKTKSRGVKQAGFVVLRQATMPSVLIETGFLSNPQEEKYLMSKEGQSEMASSISNGIHAYFKDRVPTVVKNDPEQTTAVTEKNFVVQVGAFSQPMNETMKTDLSSHGQLLKDQVNGLYKYSIGYFEEKNDAYTACEALKSDGFTDAFVKSLQSKK